VAVSDRGIGDGVYVLGDGSGFNAADIIGLFSILLLVKLLAYWFFSHR